MKDFFYIQKYDEDAFSAAKGMIRYGEAYWDVLYTLYNTSVHNNVVINFAPHFSLTGQC